MNNNIDTPKRGASRQAQAARAELDRALSFHFRGNKADALKALRTALQMDPGLATEKLPANLAHELTALPAPEALKTLMDGVSGSAIIDTAQRERQREPATRKQSILLGILVFLSLVFVGMFVWSIRDGSFLPPASPQRYTLDGYEYYMAVPRGSAPDDGWPIVVAFHGYGGDGQQLLPLSSSVNEAGAIFVAPSFGTYEPNPGSGPLEMASRILTEVSNQYPLRQGGAILFGFSQGGTFAYRFSVYYSPQVAGVVATGAPELDGILPSRNIPYVFLWGELDELQNFVMPSATAIQSRGFNVRTAIVPDVGHVVSQHAVDEVLAMLK